MTTEPRIEQRRLRPYVGIAATTSIAGEGDVITACLRRLVDWSALRRLRSDGPSFVRYRRIEMPHRLDIDVCLPMTHGVEGTGEVFSAELPAGRYAVLVHEGPIEELAEANARLQDRAQRHDVRFDVVVRGQASDWASRIETCLSDPASAPVPHPRRTEIACLIAS